MLRENKNAYAAERRRDDASLERIECAHMRWLKLVNGAARSLVVGCIDGEKRIGGYREVFAVLLLLPTRRRVSKLKIELAIETLGEAMRGGSRRSWRRLRVVGCKRRAVFRRKRGEQPCGDSGD